MGEGLILHRRRGLFTATGDRPSAQASAVFNMCGWGRGTEGRTASPQSRKTGCSWRVPGQFDPSHPPGRFRILKKQIALTRQRRMFALFKLVIHENCQTRWRSVAEPGRPGSLAPELDSPALLVPSQSRNTANNPAPRISAYRPRSERATLPPDVKIVGRLVKIGPPSAGSSSSSSQHNRHVSAGYVFKTPRRRTVAKEGTDVRH